MIDIGLVLKENFSSCDYTLVGNKYQNLEWRDKEIKKPTLESLENLWVSTKNFIDSKEVRTQRNALLADSDWAVLPDAPVADEQAWKDYRQALRDVPQQAGFPEEVVWPNPPA